MGKHKVICWIVVLLVVVGAINWGLVGLGGLIGNPSLNIVHMILGSLPAVVENVVYLLVGVAGLGLLIMHCKNKDCSCQKMDQK